MAALNQGNGGARHAGAHRQVDLAPATPNPDSPDSETVGSFGAAEVRVSSEVASARISPLSACANTVEAGENMTWMRPASRSVSACALPG